ncbi:DUF3455 domain-containing protein [Mucilaginibacter sp. BJC16-A38]|uniref:DUF3455 domain-containing protein n=1 Tax=Mucilaginibacter phenanthrenivorans TaxID=1234842 RepID=UPI0021570C91|nr:DUF3455 domain-containing protein [Mucilaginibacter phenanthrenivorans]MCR8560659.1 DUF3455 domain-containing protein [Mucilaginibacter phenanthrenivorans]
MTRTILSLLLVVGGLTCFAQTQEIPVAIKVPENCSLIMHAYAKGVQVYICTQDPLDTSRYVWTFVEPRANLYAAADNSRLIGKHYLNPTKKPTWESTDGSTISGAKLQQTNSPDSLAIPWLLLKGITPGGTGKLTPVAFIQRLNTKGGKAPATANRQQKGQLLEQPYTAEYLFYIKK